MRSGSLILEEGVVRVSDHIRIRQEHFGGIIFHTNTGDTLELDHSAYKMIKWLQKAVVADIRPLLRQKQIRTVLPVLLDMDIIKYQKTTVPSETLLPSFVDDKSPDSNDHHPLSAPETVHLAVTYRCDKACPDCYAQGHMSVTGHELDTIEICNVVNAIADNDVFQLAIGGGEPFLRPDICDIVRYASSRGLSVHITTGKYYLTQQWTDTLKHIKSLHIGIRSEELINNMEDSSAKLRFLAELGVPLGANIILTRFTIQNIDRLAELLLECGFNRLIFLRYKPIADLKRWSNENPSGEELVVFKNWMTQVKWQYPHLMLRIDCAAAFLMSDIEPLTSKQAGIRGCTAGQRIVSVAPDGSVYPCSQLVGHAYNAGNLTKNSLKDIWRDSDVLKKYRNFRQNVFFIDSVCGKCTANQSCGGCRIFAKDTISGEPFCAINNMEGAS